MGVMTPHSGLLWGHSAQRPFRIYFYCFNHFKAHMPDCALLGGGFVLGGGVPAGGDGILGVMMLSGGVDLEWG